jgi:methyltransferase-like protein/trans-aconitate methyltransferase
MTHQAPATSYDDVPYPSLCYTQTHPDRLSTIATLLGMNPTPIDHCRVLELGCAVGGNLLPMAMGLPESTFVGIDISPRQIEEAQVAAEALRLKNISFKAMDILDFSADEGLFDYIIVHGIYSWVPPEVQDKVLAICRQNLAPQGVAYVSYNTYPGSHMFMMVREMMLYRLRDIEDPHERAAESRAYIGYVSEIAPSGDNEAYAAFLKTYMDMRPKQALGYHDRDDAAVLHDELAEYNAPCYFHEFIDHAAQHDLQYLAEADFPTVIPNNLVSGEALQYLYQIAKTPIEVEQHLDFLRNRMFRRTLLCHADVAVNRNLTPKTVPNFFITSLAQIMEPEDDEKPENPNVEQFRSEDGAVFSTDHPLVKAAFYHLIKTTPEAIAFRELLAMTQEQVTDYAPDYVPDVTDQTALASSLLQAFCYSLQLIEFHTHVPVLSVDVSDYPTASLLARLQVQDTSKVTNLWHKRVDLAGNRAFIPYLDGQHDRAALIKVLEGFVNEGQLKLQEDGNPIQDPARIQAILEQVLDRSLMWLAKSALLVD